jgi:2-amino-4-hydroxy-6-hydroxymethyldihydropteridine diphosphokinase
VRKISEFILSLGTNIGERFQNLQIAVSSLSNVFKTRILNVSKIYTTAPFGVPDEQEDYLNCCVRFETELMPQTILGCCLGVESAMGRVRKIKFSSRIIDIDLLLFENEIFKNSDLVLPHPFIRERAFVLKPLSEICEKNRFKNYDFSQALKNIDFSSVNLYEHQF